MQTLTQQLANPTRFMELSARILPWVSGIAAALVVYGLYLAFFDSPADYQQGETVRIMYIHVPCAWLSMMVYGLIAVSSFGLLVFRHPLADVSAKAAAPIGAAFTFLALVDGIAMGQADVGYLLGLGCAPDIGADLVFPLSRIDRTPGFARG